jgi:membrane-bound serine protease (ClpP class)
MHHLLLFIPIVALVLFLLLPWWLALPLYLPILVSSLVGYWKALQTLGQAPVTGETAMIGGHAKVVSVKTGEVNVEYQGEIWRAVCPHRLLRGQDVIIEAVDGLTLKVKPATEDMTREQDG